MKLREFQFTRGYIGMVRGVHPLILKAEHKKKKLFNFECLQLREEEGGLHGSLMDILNIFLAPKFRGR